MTEFIVSLEQLQKLADKLEPEPKETYKVKITLPKIVRCRDCKHYKPWLLSRPENGGDCVLNKVEVDVPPDGFCAWGERKVGE